MPDPAASTKPIALELVDAIVALCLTLDAAAATRDPDAVAGDRPFPAEHATREIVAAAQTVEVTLDRFRRVVPDVRGNVPVGGESYDAKAFAAALEKALREGMDQVFGAGEVLPKGKALVLNRITGKPQWAEAEIPLSDVSKLSIGEYLSRAHALGRTFYRDMVVADLNCLTELSMRFWNLAMHALGFVQAIFVTPEDHVYKCDRRVDLSPKEAAVFCALFRLSMSANRTEPITAKDVENEVNKGGLRYENCSKLLSGLHLHPELGQFIKTSGKEKSGYKVIIYPD